MSAASVMEPSVGVTLGTRQSHLEAHFQRFKLLHNSPRLSDVVLQLVDCPHAAPVHTAPSAAGTPSPATSTSWPPPSSQDVVALQSPRTAGGRMQNLAPVPCAAEQQGLAAQKTGSLRSYLDVCILSVAAPSQACQPHLRSGGSTNAAHTSSSSAASGHACLSLQPADPAACSPFSANLDHHPSQHSLSPRSHPQQLPTQMSPAPSTDQLHTAQATFLASNKQPGGFHVWKTMPAHSQILAAGSEVFDAQLERWCQETAACSQAGNASSGQHTSTSSASIGNGRNVRTLQLYVAEADIVAAEAMIVFFYSGLLPTTLHQLDLVHLLRVADAYGAGICGGAAAQALADLPVSDQDVQIVHAMLELPETLRQQQHVKQALQQATRRAMTPFLDLEAAVASDSSLAAFCKLRHEVVHAIFMCGELKVASENTVLLALACWVEAQPFPHELGFQEHLTVLCDLVHFHCLSASYVLAIAARLPWYWQRACCHPDRAVDLHAAALLRDHYKSHKHDKADKATTDAIGKLADLKSCAQRRQSRIKCATWKWDLDSPTLQSASAPVTFSGYVWTLEFYKPDLPKVKDASRALPTVTLSARNEGFLCLVPRVHPRVGALEAPVSSQDAMSTGTPRQHAPRRDPGAIQVVVEDAKVVYTSLSMPGSRIYTGHPGNGDVGFTLGVKTQFAPDPFPFPLEAGPGAEGGPGQGPIWHFKVEIGKLVV